NDDAGALFHARRFWVPAFAGMTMLGGGGRAVKVRLHLLISAVVVCSLPFLSVAQAQTLDYSLFDPAPDDALRPFCTDRPTKGTGPCTVDAGHLQIESDIFNATQQNSDGAVTDTYLYTNPTFRLGLTESLDLELNIVPDEEVVT